MTAPFQSLLKDFFKFCGCSFPNGSPGRELLYRNQYEHAPAQIFISHVYISTGTGLSTRVVVLKRKAFCGSNEGDFFRFRCPPRDVYRTKVQVDKVYTCPGLPLSSGLMMMMRLLTPSVHSRDVEP